MEIFNGQGRRFDDSAQRSASNECVRLIRKLRWIGMDDEAERVLAQLSGWPSRLRKPLSLVRGRQTNIAMGATTIVWRSVTTGHPFDMCR